MFSLTRSLWVAFFLLMSAALMADDITWIDVRSADEYQAGHVEAAFNIPYDEIADGVAALGLSKDQAIYLYCRSGRRSVIALETLAALGYTQLTNLGGLEEAQEKWAAD